MPKGSDLLVAALENEGVDRIFLTGGSSLVPAVRAIFHRRPPSAVVVAISAA